MEKVAVITDSTSDLSFETLEKYNIKMVPLQVIYKDKSYRDRLEISPDEVNKRFATEIPKTSLPFPQDFVDCVEKLKDEGYTHVICINISSGLSGTYNMIDKLAKTIEGINIYVFDSKTVSMGIGLTVLEVARAVQNGMGFDDAVKLTHDSYNRTKGYFVVRTLEYLKKGGRIGKIEGTIGELLNIKPVVLVNPDGVYETFKKVRGRKKSIDELLEIVKQKSHKMLRIAVVQSDADEECQPFLEKIRSLSYVKEVFYEYISPVLTVHAGPGLVGVIIQDIE